MVCNWHYSGSQKPASKLVEEEEPEETDRRLEAELHKHTQLFRKLKNNNQTEEHKRTLQSVEECHEEWSLKLHSKNARQYCDLCGNWGHKQGYCEQELQFLHWSVQERMDPIRQAMAKMTSTAHQEFFNAWSEHVFPMMCLRIHSMVGTLLVVEEKNQWGNVKGMNCRACGEDITVAGIHGHLESKIEAGDDEHGCGQWTRPEARLRPDTFAVPLKTVWGEQCLEQLTYFGVLLQCVGRMATDIFLQHQTHPEEPADASASGSIHAFSEFGACVCPLCVVVGSTQYHSMTVRGDSNSRQDPREHIFGVPLAKDFNKQCYSNIPGSENVRFFWLRRAKQYKQARNKRR